MRTQFLKKSLQKIKIARPFNYALDHVSFPDFPFEKQHTNDLPKSIPTNSIKLDKNKSVLPKNGLNQHPFEFHYQENSKTCKETSEFEINIGKSIDGIRADFHGFLDDGLVYTDIYSSDILLEEPYHSGLKIQGRHLYTIFSKLTRISLLWYYQDVTLTLTHFQLRKSGGNDLIPDNSHNDKALSNVAPLISDAVQLMDRYSSKEGSRPNPESLPSLYARFVLEGTPRPALLLSLPLSTPLPRKSYTVLFKYKFHPTGLISHHIVEKIQPAPDLASLFPRVAWWWWFRGAKSEFHAGTS